MSKDLSVNWEYYISVVHKIKLRSWAINLFLFFKENLLLIRLVYFMNENDKDRLLCVRSRYLEKFGLSWWPFLYEYLPGLPKLVPLVILEAIQDKSFRYILTCIQVSALKIITFLFCLGSSFDYKRTLLHIMWLVSWVMVHGVSNLRVRN